MTAERIAEKAAYVRSRLEMLERIPQESFDAFVADFRNFETALHGLQTAIQAMLDVGTVAIAERGLAPPRSSLDVVQTLEDAGLMPTGSTERFRPMIGFRNRVVHLYDRLDPAIVYRILTEERGDLRDLLALLLRAADAARPDVEPS
jgi:uncharacterized protein YutE (UPF0331/DUF86 family)